MPWPPTLLYLRVHLDTSRQCKVLDALQRAGEVRHILT